ncbi:MAG: amino acid ABC transporter permease [Chloroflexi bacterium]|nr:amino acid ABC transporter permease [Chloroflexota bacterium]MDA1002339.1 amino acid ABC transporter permease [Chloroflexota bacterium]
MTTQSLTRPVARLTFARAGRWVRKNLFSSWLNSLLTVVTFAVIAWVGFSVIRFVLVSADWTVVEANRRLLFIGRFPKAEEWRIWPALWAVMAVGGAAYGRWAPFARRDLPVIALGLLFVFAFFAEGTAALLVGVGVLLAAAAYLGGRFVARDERRAAVASRLILIAGALLLPVTVVLFTVASGVRTTLWGGLLLNIMLASIGIAGGFALGVPLALARASTMPVIRVTATTYIELVRAGPLIAWLFLARFVLPDFLPPIGPIADLHIVARAMLVLAGFTAAYVAEVVRGGLQSLPHGQEEAAQALGLSGFQTTWLIVLPQALRAVIPALVSQFISLWKDTTLVFGLSLLELLGASEAAIAQQRFIGRQAEVLLFAGFVFWLVSLTMSRLSQRIERSLGVGER